MAVVHYIACCLLGYEIGTALANIVLHKPVGEALLNALILLLIIQLLSPKPSE